MFENAFNNIDKIMRNDESLASELDYAEQTSWLLFLKYLDDLEADREDNAGLKGKDYRSFLAPAFSWQNWAAPQDDSGEFDHMGMSACWVLGWPLLSHIFPMETDQVAST